MHEHALQKGDVYLASVCVAFCCICFCLSSGWRIGWITVHDADHAFAEAGVPETLLKLCQARLATIGTFMYVITKAFHPLQLAQGFDRPLQHAKESHRVEDKLEFASVSR